MVIFNLYTGGKKNQIIRKYERLNELFASIGGFLNFLTIFGFILSRLETEFRIKYIMMNELYNLEQVQTLGVKNLQTFKSRWSSFGLSPKKSNAKDSNLAFGQATANETKERKYWKFNFLQYLKFLLKFSICDLTPKESIFKKGAQLVDENLDIVKIIRKLQEIDKLKKIFLDNRQSELFKYMEKPTIHENRVIQQADLKKIYEETKKNAKKNPADQRLIQMVHLPGVDPKEISISSVFSIPGEEKPNKIK